MKTQLLLNIGFAVLCSIVINVLLIVAVYLNTVRKKITVDPKIPNSTFVSSSDVLDETFESMIYGKDCWTTTNDSKHAVSLKFNKPYRVTAYSIAFQEPYLHEDVFSVISRTPNINIGPKKSDFIQYNVVTDPYYFLTSDDGLVTTYFFNLTNPLVLSEVVIGFGSIVQNKTTRNVCNLSVYGTSID